MDTGLVFAAIAWTALCIPGLREVWRIFRWSKAVATVTGHEVTPGYRDDGSIRIEFKVPGVEVPICTSLWSKFEHVLLPKYPLGSEVAIMYDPRSPTAVTWPRNVVEVGFIVLVMLLPVMAWVKNAL